MRKNLAIVVLAFLLGLTGSEAVAVSIDPIVTAVPEPDVCEISAGSIDGLQVGESLIVMRREKAEARYVAQIVVTKLSEERATCKVKPGTKRSDVRRGDRVLPRPGETFAAKQPVATPNATLSKEDQAALELGRKVLAVKRAIENPKAPTAMKAVTDLGHDSRYYTMVRGWLSYQLQGAQSIAQASKERTPEKIRDQIEFLKKAIRRVDLE